MTLPEQIPIFPLPNVVFFPAMPLPLHIFEPRYREMVRDASRGGRLIGMVLLRGDWERDYQGRPPVFGTGTVGEMVRMQELPDGRFNIILRGVREFTIVREVQRAAYREAVVTWREPPRDGTLPAGTRERIDARVRQCLELLGRELGDESLVRSRVDDETFVNFFAQHLDIPPVEKQALLEAPTLLERARQLLDVLEFRIDELRLHPNGQSRPH